MNVDAEGYLVFPDENAYAAYLDAHPDRYPSELYAYYLDERGFKISYSDWEPTSEKAQELDKARRQIAQGGTYRLEDVIEELGLRKR